MRPLTVLFGAIWLMWKARALNALMMGEESAYSLGVHAARLRLSTEMWRKYVTRASTPRQGSSAKISAL